MPQMKEHWQAIFGELAASAGREDLVGKLRTADLPDKIKEAQLKKYKSLAIFPDDLVEMPRAGFVSRIKSGDEILICVQTDDFSTSELQELENSLAAYGANSDELDESTFMVLSHGLRGAYRPKADFLDKDAAFNQIGIAEEPTYEGHEISDVMQLFEDVSLFRIDPNSDLASCNKWFLAAYIAACCSAFRTKSFPQDTSEKLNALLQLKNSNPELIFYAVTSIHLRQCFLEVYRGLETLFYLPWMKLLKDELSFTGSGRSLASTLRKSIGWRQKEKESICELFALADNAMVMDNRINSLPSFKDLNFDEVNNQAIARRIYKIRNILVHQEDYDDPSPINLTQECWPVLVDYLLDVTVHLYTTFGADADFDFDEGARRAENA
ncbi:hypothetical protein [Shimia sp. MIT1388]|uniref:hypothetical protein n=1 Tax=Shimia sp. MIT1388 TaxID=3096992 RepID=UPI003999C0BC